MLTKIKRVLAASSSLAVACAGVGVVATVSSASPAHAALPAVPAKSADAFVDSIGVATHLTYADTAYGNHALIAQRLSESGIRHIRDGWGTGSSYASTFVRDTLGPKGVRITMVQDPRNNATAVQQKDMVKRELLPVIAGVESLNEWDTRGSGWASYARDWTIQMSNAYRSDPVTAKIPLLGPSMADTNNSNNHAAMGDLSPYVDFGNSHDYPGNQYQMTDQIMNTVRKNMGLMVPGRPVIATETGFSNGTVNQPYPAMPEAQVAVVLPRLYLEHFKEGIARSFSYELIDQHPNNEFESRFGLLRNDGSPKPSFGAIAGLTKLLADPGPAFTLGSLPYTLAGTDANTRTLLLQKRDGTFWLAVWQQTKVFDGTRVVDPADRPVTLTLERPAAGIKVFGLRNTNTPSAVHANAATVNLQSSEDVTLVQVAGAGSGAPVPVAPAPAPAPVPVTPVPPVIMPPVLAPTTGTPGVVSDMVWRSEANGWGPVERNRSNGEASAGDGRTLTIAGKSFVKGIGVHGSSDIRLTVGGASTFRAHVGVDDETAGRGSVRFEVWADGTRLLQTDVMRGKQTGRDISVDVEGRSELRLVVTDGDDGANFDHADWADATLL